MDARKERKSPRDLLSLTEEERRQFLTSFDHVMVDCDGCIWSLLAAPIEGAGIGLRSLQGIGKHISYVSNNGIRSLVNFRSELQRVGLHLQDDGDLVNSVVAIVHYLESSKFQGLIYVIGSRELRRTLRERGFDIVFGPDDPLEEDFAKLLDTISDHLPVRAVVFDVEFNYNYAKYIRAQRYLQDPDCILIAGATDQSISLGKNKEFAGPGAFLAMLKTHKPMVVLGKPGTELAEVLQDKFRIEEAQKVLFIGDTLEQDIQFGSKNNFQTMLVLTGVTSRDRLNRERNHDMIPDFYTDSLADLAQVCMSFQRQ